MMKTRALGAIVIGALMAWPLPATAADKGGSGAISDLEERLAEIETTAATRGNRKVTVTVTGEINKSILWLDDGDKTKFDVVEGATSPSRFGFTGQAKFMPGWTAGYRLEIGINDNLPSLPIVQDQFNIRHSAWWISAPAGKLTMGLTSMATDGITSITVANTDVASRMLSLQPVSTTFLFGLDLPFNDLRRNLVRYDTPSMGGLVISGSLVNSDGLGYGDDHFWDIAARWAGEFGGFRVAAGVGYSKQDNNLGLHPLIGLSSRDSVLSGSASAMHIKSGLFLNVAAGDVKGETALPGSGDFRAYHAQGGWQMNVTGLGATTIYGEYAKLEISGTSIAPNMFGVGLVQAIDGAAMDLYVAARRYDLDFGGDEITTLMGGARIRF